MIIRRWWLIESDRRAFTWDVLSRHLFQWAARRELLRQMERRSRQMDYPETRYGWEVYPAVRRIARSRNT